LPVHFNQCRCATASHLRAAAQVCAAGAISGDAARGAARDAFLYGTPGLWTWRPGHGRPGARSRSGGAPSTIAREYRPDLQINVTSLETGFVAFMMPATNASNVEFGGWTMLTMLEFPSEGCWRITATG
jgi:hypothetical protein